MVFRFSSHALDTYVGPELSKFTQATIPDMSGVDDQQEHWLTNYTLNTMLRGRPQPPVRQQLFNFLRRSHSAFTEYAAARESTLRYLENRDAIRRYVDAIGHWEAFLGYSWQALTLLSRQGWFEPGDGSEAQRLHALHTTAKHVDARLEAGDFDENSTLCVWLTNDGLASRTVSLSYAEAAEVLDEIAVWSAAAQDPLTMRDKLVAAGRLDPPAAEPDQ